MHGQNGFDDFNGVSDILGVMKRSYYTTDLNNVKPDDWVNWRFVISANFTANASNRPNATIGVVFCFGIDINNYFQVAVCLGATVFVRHCNYGTWTSWVEK